MKEKPKERINLDKLPKFDMEPRGRIERRTARLRESCDSQTFAMAVATTAEVYIACMHAAEEVVRILEQEAREKAKSLGGPAPTAQSTEMRETRIKDVANSIIGMLRSAQGNQAAPMPMTPEMLNQMLRGQIIQ